MSSKRILTILDVQAAATDALSRIVRHMNYADPLARNPVYIYPVPRGGIPAAFAIAAARGRYDTAVVIVDEIKHADIIVDDIVDSGATRAAFAHTGKLFVALFERGYNLGDEWLVFPWEGDAVGSVSDNITRILQYVGEDPKRGGLVETPARVVKAWDHWCGGYKIDPASLLKTFEDGAEKCDEMVAVRNIPFYSHCEHHLAPFFGTATVAYIPNGKVVGLSKISRLVDAYARRLQVQERLTGQIADALHEHLEPLGVGVVLTARHMCMESRGICQQGHSTTTSALRGKLKAEPAARAEFLALAGVR